MDNNKIKLILRDDPSRPINHPDDVKVRHSVLKTVYVDDNFHELYSGIINGVTLSGDTIVLSTFNNGNFNVDLGGIIGSGSTRDDYVVSGSYDVNSGVLDLVRNYGEIISISGFTSGSDMSVTLLVTPNIEVLWDVKFYDGSDGGPGNNTNIKHLHVPDGCIVSTLSGATYTKYKYNVDYGSNPPIIEPAVISGSWGPTDYGNNIYSPHFSISGVTTYTTANVIFKKPKTGFTIVNDQLIPSVGDDITTDLISVSFYQSWATGSISGQTPNITELQSILNNNNKNSGAVSNTGPLTDSHISVSGNSYHVVIWYKGYRGDITNIIMDDSTTVFGNYSDNGVRDIQLINESGKIYTYNYIVSNDMGCFTNNKLRYEF